MTDLPLDLSRRRLLVAAGIGLAGATTLAASGARAAGEQGQPQASIGTSPADTPTVAGLHLQFGADAATSVTASWHTLRPVANPRVLLGHMDGTLQQTVAATSASYVDAKSKQTVYALHATLSGLQPDTAYMYAALHDGASAEFGTFQTGPRGRAAPPATPGRG